MKDKIEEAIDQVVEGGDASYKMSFVQDLMDGEEPSIVPEFSTIGTLGGIFEKLEDALVLDATLSSWVHSNISKIKGTHVEVYEVMNPNERNFIVLSAPDVGDDEIISAVVEQG